MNVRHDYPDGGHTTVTFQNPKDRDLYLAEIAKHEAKPLPTTTADGQTMNMVTGCVWGAHATLTERFTEFWAGPPTYEWCEAVYQANRRDAPANSGNIPAWLTDLLHRIWVRTHWYRCPVCGDGCADFPALHHAGTCFPARPEAEPLGQLALFTLEPAS